VKNQTVLGNKLFLLHGGFYERKVKETPGSYSLLFHVIFVLA